MTLNLGIHGASGRMGQEVIRNISKFPVKLVYKYSPSSPESNINSLFEVSDIIIDFSHSEAIKLLLDKALEYRKKLVICTTNISKEDLELIQELSKKIAILCAPNTSIGANILGFVSIKIAQVLKEEFDIGIHEIHHKHKKDTPSGTAKSIAKKIASILEKDISVSANRIGEVYGVHRIFFENKDESLEIKHEAKNRSIFATGAIKAALWLKDKNHGLYSMESVLFDQLNFSKN